MRQTSTPAKELAEQVVSDVRRATRRQFSAEEKIRIVLQGLRGEDSIAELCRREGISQNLYYRWSKEFLEAGGRARGAAAAPPGGARPKCTTRTPSTGGPRGSRRPAGSAWRVTRPGRPPPMR